MPEPNAIPRSLHDWIRTATFDLCDEAKGRLYAEYEAHFADAFEAELEAGRTPPKAQAVALAALGNPNATQGALTEIHLTPKEAATLKGDFFSLERRDDSWNAELRDFIKSFHPHPGKPLLWRERILYACLLLSYVFDSGMWHLPMAALVVTALAGMLLHLRLQRRIRRLWPERVSIRSAIIYGICLRMLFIGVFLGLMLALNPPHPSFEYKVGSWILALGVIATHAYESWPRWRVLKKLGRNAGIQDDFEPPQAQGT